MRHWNSAVDVPLLCILADRSGETIGELLEVVLKSGIVLESKLDVAEFCLRRLDDHFPFGILSTTIIYGLKHGGLELLTNIITQRRELVVAILAAGAARLVFLLASIERSSVLKYLRFVRLYLGVVNRRQFGEAALRWGLAVLARFEDEELEFARRVVAEAVALLRDAAEAVGAERSQQIFAESENRAAALRCVAARTRR
jgi:hypothetical protein